ncbi:MAG: DHH family phosphoesterase [Bacilli bacterium]|nr:DHH family phosphoesterase [Bacilli bacterium]
MKKKINHVRLITFITILFEVLGLAAFVVIYFNNFFGAKEIIIPEYVIIGASALVAFNIILLWASYLRISTYRHKTDLKAAEVIGSDVQEAYNFAMIGLVVTDENDIVIWNNDLFKDRHIDIIDLNIFDWQKDLRALKERSNSDPVKLIINNRNFEVKYLSDAGLWIFKDTTDYESIYSYSKLQAPVVGILSMDNYDEVIKGDDDYNDTITKAKDAIFKYASEHGILLRKFKDSNYLMLCNYEAYSKMKDDNFSIVDKVRSISFGGDVPLTLSIGIARDFPDVVKLNELANAALEIAMSRGGDQVVVSVYGKEMEFYGGKTEAQEKRSRVKTRVLADSLINLIKGASNVLIMGHTNMDMDALGSCLGVKAICERLKIPARLVVDLKATEAKTRAALTSSFSRDVLEQLVVNSKDAVSLVKSDTLVVVCDVHIPNMVMAPALLDHTNKVVVIDHHRRAEEYIESPVFNYIDPAASSASELITEFIRFSSISPRIELNPTYATIMLSGIFLDSSFYKSKNTGIRTFEASTILKEFGADNSVADDLLKDDFEEYIETTNIVSNLKTVDYGVVYAIADPSQIYDSASISKAANACLSMKGIHAAFVIGKTSNKEIKISARSDGLINVSKLCEKLGGGGHFTSSAATFLKSNVSEVEEMLVNVIHKHLSEAKADVANRRNIGQEDM